MAYTTAAASIALAVIGTGVSVYGQMQAADAQKAQANYTAAIGRNNAILAGRAADDARAKGEADAASRAQQGAQLLGRQRAVFAGNGVLVDNGSALDIGADTAAQNKVDELTIRSNAQKQALGFEAQGANFTNQANLADLSGSNAYSAGMTGAFGSALSGAGSVASKWYDLNYKTPSSNTTQLYG